MRINIVPATVPGITRQEAEAFQDLLKIYAAHVSKNTEKDKYYEGKISLGEVNLGIALPNGMSGLEIGCAWGAKTVDVLASRSMFDGFVGAGGENVDELDQLVQDNRLIAEYIPGEEKT